jgi:hypothetical protein
MTQPEDQGPEDLVRLPQIEPDKQWEIRVRARCHAEIARRMRRTARPPHQSRPRMIFLEAAALAALFLYLSAILAETVRLSGSG